MNDYLLPEETKKLMPSLEKELSPSLRMDKYLKWPDQNTNSKDQKHRTENVDKIAESGTDLAKFHVMLFSSAITESIPFIGKLMARLMVNHSGGVIENGGICLHRHSSQPMIPGTAVKGCARAEAIRELAQAPQEKKKEILARLLVVFGWGESDYTLKKGKDLIEQSDLIQAWCFNDNKDSFPLEWFKKLSAFGGVVSFLPAYPKDEKQFKIGRDIVTPHHTQYYSGKQEKAWDNEAPIPNPFPVVEAKDKNSGFFKFRLALLHSVNKRVSLIFETWNIESKPAPLNDGAYWLKKGLESAGVGAKTSAGYGWFQIIENEGAK